MRLFVALLASLSILAAASAGHAALAAYDGFDYTPGAGVLPGNSGGFGFSAAWDNGTYGSDPGVGAGTLTYPFLITSGNRVETTNSGDSFRNLTTSYTDGDTFYVSFLVRLDEAASTYGGFDISPDATNTSTRIFVGDGGGVLLIGESGGGGSASSGVAVVQGVTHLLVLKVELVGGNDTVSLFVDPAVGGPEPLADAVLNSANFGTLAFARVNVGGDYSLDELRFGDTFADVLPGIPEPASLALLGAAGVLLALRNRRA